MRGYEQTRFLLRHFFLRDLRNNALALLGWSAVTGFCAALVVALLAHAVSFLHEYLYHLPPGMALSAAGASVTPHRLLLVLLCGGLLVGLAGLILRRLVRRETVDAVEANALYGGRMSLRDSLGLAGVTLLSGGFGASVGLEAAYTQLSASLGSKLGGWLQVRREDLRTLVGCGAAAAIAAAFNAPLAGAFYGFELILGSYMPATLGPVAVATLTGTLTIRALLGDEPMFSVPRAVHIDPADYVCFLLLGLAAAVFSILVMRGVTFCERLFRRNAIPGWLRPVLGAALLASLAYYFPAILGSGHGAILLELHAEHGIGWLAVLLLAKGAASAISIGSGFRGGLFSSSLFLGSLFGGIAAQVAGLFFPVDGLAYILVGMASVATGIIGTPITMVLLVLETTGDFSATLGVLAGVIAASIAVRHWFGYSFSTWRFHVRGLKIDSPLDIGWLVSLSASELMGPALASVNAAVPLSELLAKFPLGTTRYVFGTDEEGFYLGLIDLGEAHSAAGESGKTAADFLHAEPFCLLPADNIRTCLQLFREAAVEVLPVVNNQLERRLLGSLGEAQTLRRYTAELEQRQSLAGGMKDESAGIYSPAQRSM